MAMTTYQIAIEWVQPRAAPFVGWFSGDQVDQAISAAISAARSVGCRLEVKAITVQARKRQKGEV